METHFTEYNKTSSREKHLPQPFYQQKFHSWVGGLFGGWEGVSLSCANGGMGGKSINPGPTNWQISQD